MAGFGFQARQFIVNLRGNGEPLKNNQQRSYMSRAVVWESQTGRAERFLRDCLPSGPQAGGSSKHTGGPEGIAMILESLRATIHFSFIRLYRSTAMSILFSLD